MEGTYQIIQLALFLLQAWGLFLINKRLGEKYPWLSFIPLVQLYSFVKAAGKEPIWILWIILGTIFFVIPGLILMIIVLHNISKRTGNGGLMTLGFIFLPFIFFPIVGNSMPETTPVAETQVEL